RRDAGRQSGGSSAAPDGRATEGRETEAPTRQSHEKAGGRHDEITMSFWPADRGCRRGCFDDRSRIHVARAVEWYRRGAGAPVHHRLSTGGLRVRVDGSKSLLYPQTGLSTIVRWAV